MTTTGKDYGLPAEYHDWVEVGLRPRASDCQEYVEYQISHFRGGVAPYRPHYFVPPQPKMPEVGIGGVVRFTSKDGSAYRAVRRRAEGWNLFAVSDDWGYVANSELLNLVNADGFTVELDGL